MSLIYGEREKAFIRLKKEINQSPLVLDKLVQAEGAAFDSYAGEDESIGHRDTRTTLPGQIQHWVDDPAGKCIFWLNGMAGTGKSTISRTVAKTLADRRLLGASFVFKRGKGDRGIASRFFTTIAAQLVVMMPELALYIAKALDTDPALPEKAIKEQFEKLLLHPLSAIQFDLSPDRQNVILVIEALDKCEQERHIKTILHLLSSGQQLKCVGLRIFVTSRPKLPIRLGFQQMNGDAHQDITLHEILTSIIEHELRAFLQDELDQIRIDHSLPLT